MSGCGVEGKKPIEMIIVIMKIVSFHCSGYSSGNLTSSGHNSTMERDRIRTEFYATYDVMTGIRIAGTLGGFFAFVILLVMFKSRSHTNQALKDPKIVAVAAAVVLEEEERELQEKLDATGLSLYADDINYEYRRQRLLSLGEERRNLFMFHVKHKSEVEEIF